MEKEHTLARTSEKLECIDSLREALEAKEKQHQDTADKLLQTEHNVSKCVLYCNKMCIFNKMSLSILGTHLYDWTFIELHFSSRSHIFQVDNKCLQ